jgi:hypothetical protein
MQTRKAFGWVFYRVDNTSFDDDRVGKWMYFFENKEFAEKICKEAVEKNIVSEAKYSDKESGVVCFYLHYDDVNGHKRIISYFLENNLIRRTKKQSLYNISFKLDTQTIAGEYGTDFRSNITLSKFIDLETGEWII